MPTVVIVAIEEDSDDALMAAHVLTRAGWWVERLIWTDALNPAQARQKTEAADCLLVLWSSLSASNAEIFRLAEMAQRRKALVAGRLDHAVHPLTEAATIDLTGWIAGNDHLTSTQALIRAVSKVTGQAAGAVADGARPSSAKAGRRPSGAPTQNRRWALALLTLAATLALGVGVAQFWDWDAWSEERDSIFAANGQSTLSDADKNAPFVLRGAIAAKPGTAEAAEAAVMLAQLEAAAWRRVETAPDSQARLDAAATYLSSFPEGRYTAEARQMEAQERRFIEWVQQRLMKLGFLHEATGNLSKETTAAVGAFQASIAAPMTKRVDAALAKALSAATGEALPPRPDVTLQPGGPALGLAARAAGELRDCFLCPDLIILPPGQISSAPDAGGGVLTVTIAYPLAIGRAEVTQEEWQACIAEGGCTNRGAGQLVGDGQLPVVNVSFSEAQAYLRWLSRKTGQTYRLLSDSEWEYAAQSGVGGPPGAQAAQTLCGTINLGATPPTGCAARAAAPVSATALSPDRLGFRNLIGNAWEWVSDCWTAQPALPADGAARMTGCTSAERMARGGGFDTPFSVIQQGARRALPDARFANVGFRVARVLNLRPRASAP